MLSAIIMFSLTAGNVFAGSLSDAQKEKEELEEQLKDAQELIDELSNSKEDVESKLRKLDEKLTEISKRIVSLEEQLVEKELQIIDTQEELSAAQADVDSQYESMKVRIRFMYERSTDSYLETLLSSESIADFLNRTEYIYKISQYDREMLEKYKETVSGIAQLEATLEEERADLEGLKQEVLKEQEEVAALVSAKEAQLTEIGENLSEAEKLAKVYEAEIQAQNEIIAMIQEEERRKREEQEKDGISFGGVFIWPCPSSTRVTSDYGPRKSPTAGASSNHKGIDIGAAYGADIVAVADGKVTFAGYSKSAGNYITVSHGDGVYTVYMHCSSLVAEKGQKVSTGQVIAKVGSTGYSTGNHLHFGVSKNGSYVNPWDYLK